MKVQYPQWKLLLGQALCKYV